VRYTEQVFHDPPETILSLGVVLAPLQGHSAGQRAQNQNLCFRLRYWVKALSLRHASL
jgi:hypothetical protein